MPLGLPPLDVRVSSDGLHSWGRAKTISDEQLFQRAIDTTFNLTLKDRGDPVIEGESMTARVFQALVGVLLKGGGMLRRMLKATQ